MPWLFLLAYTCSGFAGLVYEVTWTRLLTQYIGHTTGAASAVVAAFLGGLAAGAAGGGALAPRFSSPACLRAYIALELGVAGAALVLPWEIRALTPVLSWAYQDGAPGLFFPSMRLALCFALVFLPSAALGATFPLAIRAVAATTPDAAQSSGALYSLNTAGAAAGALLAGFVLLPALGVSGTTLVGMLASVAAAGAVAAVVAMDRGSGTALGLPRRPVRRSAEREGGSREAAKGLPRRSREAAKAGPVDRLVVTAVLGVSGFAALLHEITWTRILSLVLGPTIYAFSAALAAVITGVALGSAAGAWMLGRVRSPAPWLALALAGAAIVVNYTSSLAGGDLVRLVASQVAGGTAPAEDWILRGLLITFALILPSAICLGAAFPLALGMVHHPTAHSPRGGGPGDHPTAHSPRGGGPGDHPTAHSPRGGGPGASAARPSESATEAGEDGGVARRFGLVYAVNTIGAVTGSLAAGFVFIPRLGLQGSLRIVSTCLIFVALAVLAWCVRSIGARMAGSFVVAVAAVTLQVAPPWDRDLLASGGYLYAPFVPEDLDREALLKAGTLLYYREGAAATVSVKRLTGTLTLAVDGKTDASNRGDMLTQKLIAHLPLLLHDAPREVAIVGLGSGVTVGSALRHPVTRVDVLEISPEVVEASHHFLAENQRALEDPRTRLIVGDGRSHLQLTTRLYDVIISEPSNPWIAGVAALFTREFFLAARARLAPGGVIGQWANAYNISDRDLRAIVATFRSVFPDGTVWLVGGDDVLLVGSKPGSATIEARLRGITAHWDRPGVAADLAERSVREPFSVLSMYAAGPAQLDAYARDAEILSDDRMTLEFSAPRELHRRASGDTSAALAALLGEEEGPAVVRQAKAAATSAEWRNRGAMMAKRDAHAAAFDDYVRALRIDPGDAPALEGLVRSATLLRRSADALSWIKTQTADRQPSVDVLIARSKLLAANGSTADAVTAAREAKRLAPARTEPLEQLASLFADTGDLAQLDEAVEDLKRAAPGRAVTAYYAAVAAFLRGRLEETVTLARRAIDTDAAFAPVHDLVGAAYTKLGRPVEARQAFETSLRFDPHDSTAYTNLGLLELAAGNRREAANYFAEALWLAPDSRAAREGLARSRPAPRGEATLR